MKRLAFICLLSLLSLSAYANKNSGNLVVIITNLTHAPCVLKNDTLIHGYYDHSKAPQFIPGGQPSLPINLHQSLYGPSIDLSYQCGAGKTIRFNTRQNYSFTAPGHIYGKVKSTNQLSGKMHMRVAHDNYAGLAQWFITD